MLDVLLRRLYLFERRAGLLWRISMLDVLLQLYLSKRRAGLLRRSRNVLGLVLRLKLCKHWAALLRGQSGLQRLRELRHVRQQMPRRQLLQEWSLREFGGRLYSHLRLIG